MNDQSKTPWLDKLFQPRNKQGLVEGMISLGGTSLEGEHLYFPALPYEAMYQDGKAIPFLEEVDFAPGGRFHGCVEYAPAVPRMPIGVMASGAEVPLLPREVTYDEHLRNMAALSDVIRRGGVPQREQAAARQLSANLLSRGLCGPLEPAEEEEDLHLPNAKGMKRRICNCGVRVKELQEEIRGPDSTFTVVLELKRKKAFAQATVTEVQIPEASLDRLADYLGARLPWFSLAADTPGAAQMLVEYIRDQLDGVPRITVFKKEGWHEHEGKHLFVYDGAAVGKDAVADCGKALIVDEDLNREQAFREALGILEIGKLCVTLPLLLMTLLGPLFRVFEAGGCVARFCGFLFGLSGSLKTSVVEVFYKFFSGQRHGSFRDTAAAIDVAIKSHWDRMLLVDDFQPAVIAAEGNAMRKVLEHLLRVFGDDIGKQRSNTRATATYGDRPKGSCIITGESVSGSYSSLLRCLLIPISRGDIDGERLRRYQEHPGLWTTNFRFMLPWVGQHWDSLTEKIRREFPEWRRAFSAVTPEPRLADTGAVLMLVAEIFLHYGTCCGGLEPGAAEAMLREWRAVMEKLLIYSSEAAQELDVAALAKEAILHGVTSGALKLAPDIGSFAAGADGFYSGDRLWLQYQSLDRMLRQYCAAEQVTCISGAKAVLPELYQKGLIVRDEESGKNSYLKRSPEVPALGKRLRMVAFIRAELDREE